MEIVLAVAIPVQAIVDVCVYVPKGIKITRSSGVHVRLGMRYPFQ